MSMTMISWLVEPDPFEAAMRKYLDEKPAIPEPFVPSVFLHENQYCLPKADADMSDDDEYFFTSPRVHFGFCSIVNSLTRLSCSSRKRLRRSHNYQFLRAFVGPFLICAPYSPWNEYGGNIGSALSPQSLRAVLRYREMFDASAYQSDFEARSELEPWGSHSMESAFEKYDRFLDYIDRIAARAEEAVESQRVLLVSSY